MDRKGFSMIELLAVLVLLAVILLIFIPDITKMINEFRNEDQVEILKSGAISAAKDYVVDGNISASNISCGNNNYISVNDLINNKYLNNNDFYESNHKIKVTYNCNTKKFESYEYIIEN